MPYGNPILGGDTLVRTAVQSAGFVAGSAGWRIGRDGSAEFNGALVRGSLSEGAAPTGPGVIIDDVLPAELASYYGATFGLTHINTATIRSYPGDGGGYWYTLSGYDTLVTGKAMEANGYVTAPPGPAVHPFVHKIWFYTPKAPLGYEHFIELGPFDTDTGGVTLRGLDSAANGIKLPRGLVTESVHTANSSGVTTETIIDSLLFDLQPNRVYCFEVGDRGQSNTGGGAVRLRVRQGGLVTSPSRVDYGDHITSSIVGRDVAVYGRGLVGHYSNAVAVNETFSLCLEGAGGTASLVGSASQPWYFRAIDVGDVGQYANLPHV